MKRIFLLAMAIAAFGIGFAQDDATGNLADKLYPQIMQASQAKDYALTKTLIEQLIEAGADISELEAEYARALAGTGNLQEGIDRLSSYLQTSPNDYLACQALGELYQQAGNPQAALTWYGKCIEINPGYARPHVSIARMAAKTDKALSIASYNQAIRLFLDANQPNGAVQLGVEAMDVDPENVELLMSLGDAMEMAGMPDKAVAFYNEGFKNAASAKEKDYATISSANYKIAKVYADKGEYDAALTYLTILIENEQYTGQYKQTFKDALTLAADCYDKKGDKAKAEEYRNRAAAI